jgi:CRP/FNR family transcriptional regulator
MDIMESIRYIRFFEGLDDISLHHIIREGRIIKLKNRENLFLEGQEGDHFYFLISGAIKLYKNHNSGKEIIIKVVKPQEVFAEVTLFENNCYPVSSTALEKSEVLAISNKSFRHLLNETGIRDRFIANLMKRMRYLTERVMYLSSYDVEERFFRFLIERYGKSESYYIDISKKEIASSIGTIPETFSRLIKNLTSTGIITWVGKNLTISSEIWNKYDLE